jgi:pantoate--beta-alanine ligase
VPVVVNTIAELRAGIAAARSGGATVALVPTMGALHDGHLALVARARELADVVVVSIFVNPLQFGPSEDLDRYPRTLEDDVAKLDALGVEFVFAPATDEMYPDGPSRTRVVAGKVGTLFEGASRPGHFDGVLTVVAKLLNIVQPDVVLFGQKDAQQVFLVRRMVADLNLPLTVEVVTTVREPDGLALSSRNRFLDAEQKRAALGLSRALAAASSSAERGVGAALEAARATLAQEAVVRLDYLEAVDPATFLPVGENHHGAATVIVAARVGETRLIDNESIQVSAHTAVSSQT